MIIIDTRERNPLVFQRYKSERATMATADYTARGLESTLVIERKSTEDLVGSLLHDNRDRFMRELQRMKAYPLRRLIIEGTRQQIENHEYRSAALPQAILGSLAAIEIRFNIPVVFAGSRDHAAALVEQWCFYALREHIQQAERILKLTQPTAAPTPAGEVTL